MGIFKRIAAVLLMGIMVGVMMVPAKVNAATDVPLNSTYFPDGDFLYYLNKANFDTNYDGILQASEISGITQIDVGNNGNIKNLKGIEYFTSLKVLKCNSNPITSLDVSKNVNLTALDCGYCDLTSLNLSKNTKLENLRIFFSGFLFM